MSKLGRYSAQRRKVQALGATATTIQVADCGTEFTFTQGAAVDHTLPAVADAGAGWWARFTLITAASNAVDIVSADNDNIYLCANDSAAAVGAQSGTPSDKIIFTSGTAVAGDNVYIWTDGSNWYANSLSQANDGITASG
tara:strand:- start:335 stop:754 length:420 start_codon:yes stop_codon:yes gene_type:complete